MACAAPAPLRPDCLALDGAWRPDAWRVPPRRQPRRHIGLEFVVVTLVAIYNLVGNLWLPHSMYVPANLAAGAVLVALAIGSGAGWEHLGLVRARVPRGLATGGIAMGIIGLWVTLGVALPATRSLFDDARVAAASTWELVYQPLVRIPIGTAVFEELVFRGVLLGMFLRWTTPLRAATWSSLLFGLWHVLPTGLTVDNNGAFGGLADTHWGLVLAVAGGVVGTWMVGYLFCWLRLRANSLAAPILLHTATNSLHYLGAIIVVRLVRR